MSLELGSKCTGTTLAKAQTIKKLDVGETRASVEIVSDVNLRQKDQEEFLPAVAHNFSG